MGSHRARTVALGMAVIAACSTPEPSLRVPPGSTAPAVACVEFEVHEIDNLRWFTSPSVVGVNTRAVGSVSAVLGNDTVRVGDTVWVDYDRVVPPGWAVGDRGTLAIDAIGGVTRVIRGRMPAPCPQGGGNEGP